jgi:hypothetical protein
LAHGVMPALFHHLEALAGEVGERTHFLGRA